LQHGTNTDVNKEDAEGRTLLFNASKDRKENIMKYLVEHGADVNKECIYGNIPLFYAYLDIIIDYLVEHGTDIYKENNPCKNLLFNACEKENEKFTEYLGEHGIDINNGETPLSIAYSRENKNNIKYYWNMEKM